MASFEATAADYQKARALDHEMDNHLRSVHSGLDALPAKGVVSPSTVHGPIGLSPFTVAP